MVSAPKQAAEEEMDSRNTQQVAERIRDFDVGGKPEGEAVGMGVNAKGGPLSSEGGSVTPTLEQIPQKRGFWGRHLSSWPSPHEH